MRRIHVKTRLEHRRTRKTLSRCGGWVSRSHWQIIWLLAQGQRSEEIHKSTGYSVKWIQAWRGAIHSRAAGIGDKRTEHSGRKAELKPSQQGPIEDAAPGSASSNEYWTGTACGGVDK